jgi:hypothetical protein
MTTLLPKYVCLSIEGNIGSGKSTILNKLKDAHPEWNFVDEPVGEWMTLKDDQGKELIIPLNTPDGRPIFMNPENAIAEGSVNH